MSTTPEQDRPASPELVPAPAARRPTVNLLLSHPAHFIAFGAGSGLSPVAPGTIGTLWAWLAFWGAQRVWGAALPWGWVLPVATLIGWWACTHTARSLRVADPGAIVWDEVVAFWAVLAVLAPADLLTQAAAFAVFRYFDAAKPGPVRWADGLFKSRAGEPVGWAQGFGILFDDLVAAFCTLLVFALYAAARQLLSA